MKKIPFVHFIDWKKTPDDQLDSQLDELLEAGVNDLVIHPYWWQQEPKTGKFLNKLRQKILQRGFKTSACHGLWGKDYDLNCINEEQRIGIIENHCRFICHIADMDCKTYTVHLGHRYEGWTKQVLYDNVRRSLDQMLKTAEKTGVKIALENMIEYDTSNEVAELAAEYNHPLLGLCLDTGHAHAGEGLENAVKNMAPYLVTCHLHDNNGASDQHFPPGFGSIGWQKFLSALRQCPYLECAETESGPCGTMTDTEIWNCFTKVWQEF